jgi:hypothetical protein
MDLHILSPAGLYDVYKENFAFVFNITPAFVSEAVS